jgi:hypothetical protein
MEIEKTHFVKQVFDYLYPKKNRVIAAVAFVRTFKQAITGTAVVGGGGLIAINAQDIANLNWEVVMYTAIAVLLTATIAGASAFDDVSRNGLNSKYMDAATTPEPSIIVDPAFVKQVLRPDFFVPAPVAAPEPTKTAAKKPVRKAASKKVAAKVDNVVEHKGMKVDQAPAVEVA